ncbi:DUF294 nucleotidyltransferase-like domain-containing protein [Mesobacillus thioparans]|uniref:DUF294 nucleotidyltransferase-like domain-containing protein n=1 Tax=Mesobacillus thioparans TaxID=370439 RepID=UPI0039EF88F0
MANEYSEMHEIWLLNMNDDAQDNETLNLFHDSVYQRIISMALKNTSLKYGSPPSPFVFFVMGSAGRKEQSLWSDQDHGMVFTADTSEAQDYFLRLGIEISNGLEQSGYQRCTGNVMADNPLWCKSLKQWEKQLDSWVRESSWESIRHLLIFADARALYGESYLIATLKERSIEAVKQSNLYTRMLQNTMHIKKGVGLLGQFLVETHGSLSGSINLKETAFLPFVNASRLISFIEENKETTTLLRIKQGDTCLSFEEKEYFSKSFALLLEFRLHHSDHRDYESGHYIHVGHLTKQDKKTLKEILKAAERFYEKIRNLINGM